MIINSYFPYIIRVKNFDTFSGFRRAPLSGPHTLLSLANTPSYPPIFRSWQKPWWAHHNITLLFLYKISNPLLNNGQIWLGTAETPTIVSLLQWLQIWTYRWLKFSRIPYWQCMAAWFWLVLGKWQNSWKYAMTL